MEGAAGRGPDLGTTTMPTSTCTPTRENVLVRSAYRAKIEDSSASTVDGRFGTDHVGVTPPPGGGQTGLQARRPAFYFRRPPSFKSEGAIAQTKVGAKSRTEGTTGARGGLLPGNYRLALLPVPAVQADVKVATATSRATSHRSRRPTRYRRPCGHDTMDTHDTHPHQERRDSR